MWGIKSNHFPTSSPLPSPHSFPTRLHTSPLTPYTFPHPPDTSPLPTHLSLPPPHHISLHLPPHPISLPTAPLTSPYTPTHFLIHPMHSPTPLSPHLTPQFRLCGEVTKQLEKPDQIFYGNREFKVLFRCRQCKFLMYESVAKLPCGEVTVAKLLATPHFMFQTAKK